MPIKFNFSEFQKQEDLKHIQNPKDIFKLLSKTPNRFNYLREVQAEVLDAWYLKKSEREILIKMNTGSGKTVVALLILKSYLNQGLGPVVYIVPDNYLLTQVENEAKA